MAPKRRTSAEIIAFHLGWDIREVSDCRYQPTRYAAPAVYTIGEYYFCSPSRAQKLPKGWHWEKIGRHYERDVFRAHMNAGG